MVATLDVASKSNEITAFALLLDQIGCLKNVVITADRLHTQRKHARYLHQREAFYVFPVGGNQPGQFDQRVAGTAAGQYRHESDRARDHRFAFIFMVQFRVVRMYRPRLIPGVVPEDIAETGRIKPGCL